MSGGLNASVYNINGIRLTRDQNYKNTNLFLETKISKAD